MELSHSTVSIPHGPAGVQRGSCTNVDYIPLIVLLWDVECFAHESLLSIFLSTYITYRLRTVWCERHKKPNVVNQECAIPIAAWCKLHYRVKWQMSAHLSQMYAETALKLPVATCMTSRYLNVMYVHLSQYNADWVVVELRGGWTKKGRGPALSEFIFDMIGLNPHVQARWAMLLMN